MWAVAYWSSEGERCAFVVGSERAWRAWASICVGVNRNEMLRFFGNREEGRARGVVRGWGGVFTLAMRARRKERTRNLKRSSSVWMMMRRKLALGSVLPVCSSTSSIFRVRRLQCLAAREELEVFKVPADVSAPKHAPSKYSAMGVILVHSAPSPMLE